MECKHKYVFIAENWGVKLHHCDLYCNWVNETICAACPARSGVSPKQLYHVDLPTRPPSEVERVFTICKGCPLFDAFDQTCRKLRDCPIPVDVYAQNPQHECPEGLW